ncbi:MAG TPA: protein phosphatase 2C domain-containing protein [Myxococcota bacterium]
MRTALLCGREHTVLGGVSAIAEGSTAIAISRGGASKTYAHRDPNEDAAAFAASPQGVAIAVADGHAGHRASEVALERLLEVHAERWLYGDANGLKEGWREGVADVLLDLNHAVLASATRGGGQSTRTTLAVAIARPGDDLLAFFSMGDSHIFDVRPDGVIEHAAAGDTRITFLGHPAEDRERLRRKYRADVTSLGDSRALVLATDGLSETGIGVANPAEAIAVCAAECDRKQPDLRPLGMARGLVERALEAQRVQRAGDNVATAVAWLR